VQKNIDMHEGGEKCSGKCMRNPIGKRVIIRVIIMKIGCPYARVT
jgi:hypothetical protein